MLVEEFKRCIQSDVKTFFDEKQVETLEEAARLADDYYLTHKVSFIAKPKPTSSHPQNKFMSGNLSLSGDNCPPTPIKILRDTGASQSLILADILPFSVKTSSGTSVLIQGVECVTVNIPLHHVNLSSDLVTGLVVISIKPFFTI